MGSRHAAIGHTTPAHSRPAVVSDAGHHGPAPSCTRQHGRQQCGAFPPSPSEDLAQHALVPFRERGSTMRDTQVLRSRPRRVCLAAHGARWRTGGEFVDRVSRPVQVVRSRSDLRRERTPRRTVVPFRVLRFALRLGLVGSLPGPALLTENDEGRPSEVPQMPRDRDHRGRSPWGRPRDVTHFRCTPNSRVVHAAAPERWAVRVERPGVSGGS